MVKTSDKGFTLLELMISLTIFSVMLLIIFGAIRLGYRSIEKAEKTTEFLERIRTTINIIEAQLQSQIPLTYEENGEKKLYFAGQKEFVQFSSNYSAWSGQRGYVRVIYNIESDSNGKKALYVTENTISMDDSRKTMLLNGLEGISFRYFLKEPQNLDGEWRDEWNETAFMPEKVAINIFDSSRKISMNLLLSIKNKPSHSINKPSPSPEPRRDFPKQGVPVKN